MRKILANYLLPTARRTAPTAAWLLLLALPIAGQAPHIAGTVRDSTGAVLPGAHVHLLSRSSGAVRTVIADAAGAFEFLELTPGDYWVLASAPGFAEARRLIVVDDGRSLSLVLELRPAGPREQVLVRGHELLPGAEAAAQIPGSLSRLDSAVLTSSRCLSVEEALRKLPGVFVRGEEGLGFRPNIGIRGLNPTRSTKVLLLEDGIPLAYAPYGDNAAYYHPPLDRFESVEIIKGAGQILYGPATVGGVINYLTPPIPDRPAGELDLAVGDRDYVAGHLRYGGTWNRTGLLGAVTRKQSEGARANVRLGLSDLTLKTMTALGQDRIVAGRLTLYRERSRNTYSGLTEAEFAADPRQNPFRNDRFEADRLGAALSYSEAFSARRVLAVNLYGSHFNRDWWRQSSNSLQRPNRLGVAGCRSMTDLNSSCGNEGRLRGYYVWGVEPRMRWEHPFAGWSASADFGLRGHFEDQDRQQKNGSLPWSRDGLLVEDNKRRTQAYSAWWQQRFSRESWGLTPGLRWERVRYQRHNRLTGASGRTVIDQWIPGLGMWVARGSWSGFAGLHRGFAPPRAEDVINNQGGTVDLEPELSWNYEVGARWRKAPEFSMEWTAFQMDYRNQIAPASVAGGIGATLTSAGRTRHRGLEWAGQWGWPRPGGWPHAFSSRVAYTWVPVARFSGPRYSAVPGYGGVSVTGNRLPYAPRQLLSASLIYTHRRGATAVVEAVATSSQFSDDLNTLENSWDGQRGLLPGHVLWNATLNHPIPALRGSLFVSAKNLFDRLVIVDRSRGLLPGHPRLVQCGLRWRF